MALISNNMAQFQDCFSLNLKMQDNKTPEHGSWEQRWSNWDATATPVEMPIWQYTATALSSGDYAPSYYPNESPVSAHSNLPSSLPSTTNSPRGVQFPGDGRFTPLAHTSEGQIPSLRKPPQQPIHVGVDPEDDYMEDKSDGGSWEPKTPNGLSVSTPVRPAHRRAKSSNEVLTRDAKRAHTVVERNYRERLNDKIAELGLYLFETSSDARTKPSKSLIMTRAKERLQQLEARNKALEAEVVKLRQQIAILDHIVAAKGDPGLSTPR